MARTRTWQPGATWKRSFSALLLHAALAVVSIAAAAASLVADQPLELPPPGGTFRLGCLMPLTGEKGATGRAIQAAIDMAVAREAPARLPQGFKAVVTCEDTQCSDVAALFAARKLARMGVDGIVGDVCSAASLSALAVVNKYRIPLISPASTSPLLSTRGTYFFRTVPSDRYQGQFVAAQLMALGVNSTLAAYAPDITGSALALNFVAAYSRDGGDASQFELPVTRGPAATGTAVVKRLREAGAAGLFLAVSNVTLGAAILKALHAASPPLHATVFVSDGLVTPALPSLAGAAAAAGAYGTELWSAPGFRKEFEAYVKAQGMSNVAFLAKAAAAYDAVVALMDAFRRAAAPRQGPQVAAALYGVKFAGKSGSVAFDEFGDLRYDPSTSYRLAEFQSDGKIKTLPAGARAAGAAAAAAAAAAGKVSQRGTGWANYALEPPSNK